MYAVLRTGGKQHRVVKGERLDDVLMIGGEGDPRIGQPRVEGAVVTAKILSQGLGDKIRVFKRLRRKGFHKTIGHRQPYTEIEITGIEA